MDVRMDILLFGGSGLLGTELLKSCDMVRPIHSYIDICDYESLYDYIRLINPTIIINAAAITNNRDIIKDPQDAINTNIIGSANLSLICNRENIRLVYISTDYVYSGSKGNHKESDSINPENMYAWTKLGGECSVKCVENHLIIRTSFGSDKFPYPDAFDNLYTSKDYVDIIAPMIYKAAISKTIGVLNIGTKMKSMYEYAFRRNENVGRITGKYKNFSLNTNKYETI